MIPGRRQNRPRGHLFFAEIYLGQLKDIPMPQTPLPEGLDHWARQVASKTGSVFAYVVMTLLATAAAAIGNARVGRVGPEWTVPSILWVLLVGPPAAGKSNAITRTLKPYLDLEREARAEHRAAVRLWAQTQGRLPVLEAAGDMGIDLGPMPVEPAEHAPRFVVQSATLAGLERAAMTAPRGLLAAVDEIASTLATNKP